MTDMSKEGKDGFTIDMLHYVASIVLDDADIRKTYGDNIADRRKQARAEEIKIAAEEEKIASYMVEKRKEYWLKHKGEIVYRFMPRFRTRGNCHCHYPIDYFTIKCNCGCEKISYHSKECFYRTEARIIYGLTENKND